MMRILQKEKNDIAPNQAANGHQAGQSALTRGSHEHLTMEVATVVRRSRSPSLEFRKKKAHKAPPWRSPRSAYGGTGVPSTSFVRSNITPTTSAVRVSRDRSINFGQVNRPCRTSASRSTSHTSRSPPAIIACSRDVDEVVLGVEDRELTTKDARGGRPIEQTFSGQMKVVPNVGVLDEIRVQIDRNAAL